MPEATKYLLTEDAIPTHWVNLLPDLPGEPLPRVGDHRRATRRIFCRRDPRSARGSRVRGKELA